jgi:PAP2 superfamily
MRSRILFVVLAVALVWSPLVADEVTDWNHIMLLAARAVVPPTPAPFMTRNGAIVQAAVFDAFNGIERRYTPIHVNPAAPRGASRRAAIVQAAHDALVDIYPAQTATFDADLDASLAAITSDAAAENSESIARGREWGSTVAAAIWAWRKDDVLNGSAPDGTVDGVWRKTPPAFVAYLGYELGNITTWSVLTGDQFRAPGPPALGSTQYNADFAETKSMGDVSSTLRTADQTLYSRFWNSATVTYFWNTVAVALSSERHLTLSENSRLFALLNIAIADSIITCWESKRHYYFWRPVTAIRLDGIAADASWTPLIVTPPFPEYPSGHSSASGAAATVLADSFGENTSFSVGSDVNPFAADGTVRSFASFSGARDEIKNARIFGGIHFRTACNDADQLGTNVANWVLGHSLQPVNGNHNGQTQH